MNKTWQVVLAFLVVFIAGGAIGAVFTLRYAPQAQPPRAVAPNPRPEDFGPRLVRRWMQGTKALGLTPAQRQKIQAILFDTGEDLQRAQVETIHSDRLMIENMQDQIAAILNPEQRERFYRMIEEQRDRMTRFQKEFQRRAAEKVRESGQP